MMAEGVNQQTQAGNGQANGRANGSFVGAVAEKRHHDEYNNDAPSGIEKTKRKIHESKDKAKAKTGGDDEKPTGGYDKTPIPGARDGYTVRFTFHRASNLPMADYGSQSSDPYLRATLTSRGITKRHKEDPDVILRTKTIHRTKDPEWNQVWTVSGIPSEGFRLKCRLYDEDPTDHDDRLGNVTVYQNNIANWPGLNEEEFEIKKRAGSKRAYAIRGCAAMLSRMTKMSGSLVISMEVLGKSEEPYGRMYTLGDVSWTKHFSPMIGRLAGTKNMDLGPDGKTKSERYDFQANQFQLKGPVPEKLYHRFVEFKPFVKGMFASTGLRGKVLNHALHHQHSRVYNYSSTTKYGNVKAESEEASLRFLEMTHFDEGGRIFTYVITLDGLFRFTETGKEFGIDMLSKHTMHSDVNVYIACSGEFFVRRLKRPKGSATEQNRNHETHPADKVSGGPPDESAPKHASYYELVIDNDSGTYRPDGSLLPELKKFLNRNFPELHVVTKECTDEELSKWKDEQRAIKKKQGKGFVVAQDSDGEISSSDEDRLDDVAAGGNKKTGKQRAFDALENPKQAFKDLIPGEKGRQEREQREEQGDGAKGS